MSINTIDLISDAFFASKVVDISNEKIINEESRAILQEILQKISIIREGKELVSFSKGENRLSSLTAYQRAIEIIPIVEIKLGLLDDQPEQCIEKFLSNIEEEVKKVLVNGKVADGDLMKTVYFFKELRRSAIQESNNAFMNRNETSPWLEAMKY